jgi:peroxiredoxin/Tfp pilus assembly protein PilF
MMWTIRWTSAAVLAVLCAAAVGASATEPKLKQGDTAPDFTTRMVAGGTGSLKLSSLRGKYVLVVVMTAQCPACKDDLPTINDGNKRLAGDKFYVYGVVCDGGRDDVRDLVKNHDITFPIGYDSGGKAIERFGIGGVPTSFLIDPQGKILSWSHGTAGQFDEVGKLLGAAAPAAGGNQNAGQDARPTPEALLREAIAYYNAGELQKAYVRCNQTLEAEPENVQALVLLGDLHRKVNDPAKAIAAYQRALSAIDPEDFTRIAAVYNRMANTCIGVGKYADAARVYQRAIKTIYDPEHVLEFHAYLGMCYAKLDKPKEALAAFDTFFKAYKQVDAGVQRRYAELYKRVEAQRQQLKESGGGSTNAPGPGAD